MAANMFGPSETHPVPTQFNKLEASEETMAVPPKWDSRPDSFLGVAGVKSP